MKLLLPQIGAYEESDRRLAEIAAFLGLPCEPIELEEGVQNAVGYFENVLCGRNGCLVVNAKMLKKWLRSNTPEAFVRYLTARFQVLIVHGIVADQFSAAFVRAISGGRIQSVTPIEERGEQYEFERNARDICGPFSGISFGPINAGNDYVFCIKRGSADIHTCIRIGGRPFMAVLNQGAARIAVIASCDSAELGSDITGQRLSEYFSRFVPHAMALRFLFGEQCWHPTGHYASFIIDDPLLRPRYGYVDFKRLLALMENQNFATTIAFIPHNYRRNRQSTVELFRQRSDRFSICFHGNDHTAGEFATTDIRRLNTGIAVAETRMSIHEEVTGLPCDRVMVFPQELFSVEAMEVLRSCNFLGAVKAGTNPVGNRSGLTLAEFAQPAILRFGGFPLFDRRYIGEIRAEDLAFNLFFGKPALLVEHHEIFNNRTGALIDCVRMINSMMPEIRWSRLSTAVINSGLKRMISPGLYRLRSYSSCAQISNDGDLPRRYEVEWPYTTGSPGVATVLEDDKRDVPFDVIDARIQLSTEIAGRGSVRYSVRYRNDFPRLSGLGFRWNAKAFVRRRLSELRDDYGSRSKFVMRCGEIIKRRVLSKAL
jgi:hypothetical protein